MYVDGAWNPETLNCGMGWSVSQVDELSPNVFVNRQASGSRELVALALCAEAWALRSGLIYALNAGCCDLLVRSDSQVLVALLHSAESHTQIQAILDDIRHVICTFSKIVFEYTPRSDNVVADAIAKKALVVLETVVNSSFD